MPPRTLPRNWSSGRRTWNDAIPGAINRTTDYQEIAPDLSVPAASPIPSEDRAGTASTNEASASTPGGEVANLAADNNTIPGPASQIALTLTAIWSQQDNSIRSQLAWRVI